jgi:autoinducer 2-degrading protein
MYVITVEFEIDELRVELFRVAMLTQARNSLAKESACKQFDVCFDPERPERCFLYEKYDDLAAFGVHRETRHFAEFTETVTPWIKNKIVNAWSQDDV